MLLINRYRPSRRTDAPGPCRTAGSRFDGTLLQVVQFLPARVTLSLQTPLSARLRWWKMILEASNVVKNFGGLTAVNRVSLQVAEGEVMGLIGPNGAGKTTFLNCLAGTYKPSAGTVHFRGEETTGATADVMCRKGMSRTFQIPLPFPKMTVLENVMVGAQFGGGAATRPRPNSGPWRRWTLCNSRCPLIRRRAAATRCSSNGWTWPAHGPVDLG